jgi:hypothetical protein
VRGYADADVILTIEPGQADGLASLIEMLTAATREKHQALAGALRQARAAAADPEEEESSYAAP